MCSYHLHTLQQRISHVICLKPNFTHEGERHSCQPSAQFPSHRFCNRCCIVHMPIYPHFFFWWKIIKTQNQISPLIWGYWLSSYANKISVALKQTIGEQICLPSENSSFLLESHLRKLKKGEEVELNINTKRQAVYIRFTLHILEGQVHYLYRCYLTSVQLDIRLNLLISML